MALEWRGRDPLVPLRLFGNRNLSIGIAVAFLFMATFGTLLYVLTIHFQTVRGYSALETGIAFLAPMGAGFVGSMIGGGLATRFGVRTTLVTALAVGAAGTVALGLALSPDSVYLVLLPGLVVLSVCQGVVFTCMFAAATTGVAAAEQGVAGGIVSTGAQVGSAVGLAAVVAIAHAAGLRASVFLVAAGIMVTAGFTLAFRRPPGKPLRVIAAEPAKMPDERAA
jgi:MFS family permease